MHMKKLFLLLPILFFGLMNSSAQDLAPYYDLGEFSQDMNTTVTTVENTLITSGFKVIGKYNPGNSKDMMVICYTRPDLETIALSFEDRGGLAACLKVGLKKDGSQIKLSMLNPSYLFYAYFIDGIDKHLEELSTISDDAINAMKKISTQFQGFGGELSKEKLQKYHYKMMMPYFKDGDELHEFSSFSEGLKTIQQNLEGQKGKTLKVYELIYPEKNVAVFGVALLNEEDGESKFLPIIGEDHLAAMPYEIILQGNTASMLAGKYRIALHWPELTMGTFMKIMSTPGDIKKTMKGLTK